MNSIEFTEWYGVIMYSATEWSKYIVWKCINDGMPISNLRLQMILYCLQVEYLKINLLAFPDEIQAWGCGPVVPNVYYLYCGYGAMPITNIFGLYNIDAKDKELVDFIIKKKRAMTPWQIAKEVCGTNSPWEVVYNKGNGNRAIIPISLIMQQE